MADDYNQGFEEGRQGRGYSGGGSIEYAGWMAGNDARAKQEMASSGGGGGGGGAFNFKGRVVTTGIGLGMFGMFFGLLSDGTLGGVIGFALAFTTGALIHLVFAMAGKIFQVLPVLPPLLLGSFSGAVYGVGVAVRSGEPRDTYLMQYTVAGTMLFLAVWFIWRRIFRRR